MATPKWVPLPPFSRNVPTLLVLPDFGHSSYTLHVTDMINVWVETLDRKGIMKRSLNEDTSIDPSEGSDQMAILLSKIKVAFDPTSPDYGQTSLSVSASSNDKNVGGLALLVTCVLPANLKPLRWPFELAKCPPASVVSDLVLHLLQAQHTRNLEIEALVSNLKEKDAVIDKLVNKLEAMGMGLENVFNTLPGKRKATRAAAEDKVKGLTPFYELEWKPKAMAGLEAQKDVSSLVHNVFGGPEPIYGLNQEISISDNLNDWWTKLGSNPIAVVKPDQKETSKRSEKSQPQSKSPASIDEDDDFLVQATPPHLAHRKRGRTANLDDATTDEDKPSIIPDSHPTPSQQQQKPTIGALRKTKAAVKSASASQSPWHVFASDGDTTSNSNDEPVKASQGKKPTGRLGVIGGNKKPSSTPPPVQQTSDDTASGTDDDTSVKAKFPKTRLEPSPPRKRAGLGKIGGRAKSTPEPPEGTRQISPEAASAAKFGQKLGMIGKKNTEQKEPRIETPAEQEEFEDNTTKAERKRNELAQELERKKAAGPPKKKRRF